jgi:hypothetical protein
MKITEELIVRERDVPWAYAVWTLGRKGKPNYNMNGIFLDIYNSMPSLYLYRWLPLFIFPQPDEWYLDLAVIPCHRRFTMVQYLEVSLGLDTR